MIGTGAPYIPVGNSPNLGVNHHLEVMGTGASYNQAENSSNLGVNHHLEVIVTGASYIPAVNSHNLGVNHQLEVMKQVFATSNIGHYIFMASPHLPGTNFIPWFSERCRLSDLPNITTRTGWTIQTHTVRSPTYRKSNLEPNILCYRFNYRKTL